MRVGCGQIIFVAHFGGKRTRPSSNNIWLGTEATTLTGRVRDQPAEQLLPELFMRLIFQRLAHLPAPRAAGGQHRGSAAAVVLRDQKRHLPVPASISAEHNRAGLGCSCFLVVHQVWKLFPALGILRWVLHAVG